jgi:hypothetical protein
VVAPEQGEAEGVSATGRTAGAAIGAGSKGSARPGGRRALLLHILTDAGLVLGGALGLAAFVAIANDHGGLGYDTPSYWLAGKNVLAGARLYDTDPYSTLSLYTYPPIFAQLFVPFSLLPELFVAWVWRVSGVLCLRYLTGSWPATVVCCAFVPVLTELAISNVTLQLAVVILFAMRDKRGAYLVPWAAMIKFGPALVVPYLWFHKPESRRPLAIGTLVFLAACLISFGLSPRDWSDYVDMLRFQNMTSLSGSQVIHLIPSGGGIDFVARFALAGVVALLAAYWGRGWLAYAAASITCPVMAISRFAPLVGLWRFRPAGWPSARPAAEERANGPAPSSPAPAEAAP